MVGRVLSREDVVWVGGCPLPPIGGSGLAANGNHSLFEEIVDRIFVKRGFVEKNFPRMFAERGASMIDLTGRLRHLRKYTLHRDVAKFVVLDLDKRVPFPEKLVIEDILDVVDWRDRRFPFSEQFDRLLLSMVAKPILYDFIEFLDFSVRSFIVWNCESLTSSSPPTSCNTRFAILSALVEIATHSPSAVW